MGNIGVFWRSVAELEPACWKKTLLWSLKCLEVQIELVHNQTCIHL